MAQALHLKPPAPETKALPLDQQAGTVQIHAWSNQNFFAARSSNSARKGNSEPCFLRQATNRVENLNYGFDIGGHKSVNNEANFFTNSLIR